MARVEVAFDIRPDVVCGRVVVVCIDVADDRKLVVLNIVDEVRTVGVAVFMASVVVATVVLHLSLQKSPEQQA